LFALLEHSTTEGVHWDFLVERPHSQRLPTWRLVQNPLSGTGPIDAQRIGEHRRFYLDYEGPISGGRGEVRRIDRGEATILAWSEDRVRLDLRGAVLRGRFELQRTDAGWRFARIVG
jgi:hypothetical protein